jgi:hypothetical protein
LLTYSDDFSNAVWAKFSAGAGVAPVVSSNVAVSPDGTINADSVVFSANASGDRSAIIYSAITTTNATAYTSTFYVKAQFSVDIGKVIICRQVAGSSYTQITLTSSWQKVTITETSIGVSSSIEIGLRPVVGGGSSGVVSVLFWGAQLEAGAFATSYIPTVASQVTRSPDAASMTGTNFSSWYRLDQGTFYAEASTFTTASKTGNPASVASIDDNSPNNRLQLRYGANFGSFSPRLVENGAGILSTTLTGLSINVNNKHAIGYQTGSSASVGNGTIIENKTTTFTPIAGTALYIGSGNTSDSLNGTIKKISYYTTRLTNAELQGLTTN